MEDNLAGSMIGCPHSGQMIRVPSDPFSETDWQDGTDPQAMLLGLPITVPNRKLRLFALACCQRISHQLTHPLSREALVMAGKYAEGVVTEEQMGNLAHRFMEEYSHRQSASRGNWEGVTFVDLQAAYEMVLKVFPAGAALAAVEGSRDQAMERTVQCRLLRCMMGNPFRPAKIDPAWQTATVVALSQAIDDERTFDRMPILADALEEAGCDSTEILEHCRAPGSHVRGCWVVDILLKKG